MESARIDKKICKSGGDANAVTPPVCRRLSHRLNGLENFITLLRCAGNDDTAKRFFEIASKYDVLMQPPVPLVGGMECAAAGITPGPLMGMYLKLCFDAQLDGEFDDLPGGVKYLEILLEKKHFSAKGKKITAVGTTSVRTLETAMQKYGEIKAVSDHSEIFIYPGYEFKIVDRLITNFHLPKSTLIMLVSALSSKEMILNAYEYAKDNDFRFYSYGDCMLIK